jgi:LDH2 family malate/lactate/ureidoglycolate dehydrogenase
MVEFIKDTPLAQGFEEVLYPGEKEAKNRKERTKTGVDIENETWNQVMALVKAYGVDEQIGKVL